MFTKVFHINPTDFEHEQFDALVERAKKQGYKVFDYSRTSSLDIESLDSASWVTIETEDVIKAVNSGSVRADMVDTTSTQYTPDYSLEQIKGFTEAEAWMMNDNLSAKHKAVQDELDFIFKN